MNNQELDPSVEVAHLRRLLDIQPGCLMRLGADGTVLAANDAALALLDLTSRAQALGRDFTAWVPPEQHERWKAFANAIVQGVPASIECDITIPPGNRRPALFHAMPLADHPDGLISMLVAARAVSGQRQAEAAIVELEEQLRQRDVDRQTALTEAEANRCGLVDMVAALEARVREREAAGSEAEAQLRRLRADLQARDEALAAADANLAARDAALAAADADLEARDKALAAADAARNHLTETVAALEARVRDRETAGSEAEEELRRLRADLQARDEALGAAEAARGQLVETLAALEAKVRVRETAGSEAEEQLRRLGADLQARDEALDGAAADLKVRDEALAAADAARNHLTETVAALEARVRDRE
ncbi:MAG: hypothetical protein EHM24_23955, partial [Acidobacteria bacterium]